MDFSLIFGGFFGFVLVGLGLVLLVYSVRFIATEDMSERLREYVAQSRSQIRQRTQMVIPRRELTGSLINRLVGPVIRRIGSIFGRITPAGALSDLERQLTAAGHPLRLGAREFFGLRLLILLIGFWLMFLILRSSPSRPLALLAVLILVISYIGPIGWLRSRVRQRRETIRKGLPDALDMLSVCATAGLGFDQAMQRVSEHWKTPVGREFGRVVSEMEVGLSRQEALSHMARRLEVTELSSFVSVIIQSEKLGMSIADTLMGQAEQMRIERRFRAQEQAQKMPAKMLFPLAFLILPALLLVIIGPSIPALLGVFGNLR